MNPTRQPPTGAATSVTTTEAAAAGRVQPRQGWLHRTFDSLGERNFRMLWIGLLLSMGGFQMQMVARGILVYDITDDARLTSIVGLGFAPSLLIVSLYGGVIGERMERRNIIQVAQAANGALAGLVAVLIIFDAVSWQALLGVSVAQGAMFAFQMPARQAAIPALVGQERLSNAIALNAMAMGLMTLVAPGLGGVLYEVTGPEGVYLFVTGMAVLAVIFTGLVPRIYPPADEQKQSVVENVIAGFRYIRGNRLVTVLLIQGVLIAILSMPFRMLVQVYAKDVYGSRPSEVGWMLAAAGIGGLIGSLGIAGLRKGQHRGMVLLLSAVVSGASILLISSIPIYAVGVVMTLRHKILPFYLRGSRDGGKRFPAPC